MVAILTLTGLPVGYRTLPSGIVIDLTHLPYLLCRELGRAKSTQLHSANSLIFLPSSAEQPKTALKGFLIVYALLEGELILVHVLLESVQ